MNFHWFSRKGIFFVPSSVIAWVILLGAISYLVWTFLDIDSRSHSVSDTLYGIFPFVVPCLMLLNWVASKTSGTNA